jgi:glutamate 5-kinase
VEVARGLVAYDSTDAQKIAGRKSADIEAILGYAGRNAMVHRADRRWRLTSMAFGRRRNGTTG